jgi:serine/threonine protein kinase/Tfp pilus assembly protein PilF
MNVIAMSSSPDPTPGPLGDGSTSHGRPGSGWVSRQVSAMAAAWERGERISAAEILARYPDLDTEAAIRLIFEEVCLRREAGLEADTAEVVRRYPRWGDELQALFDCDRLLRPSGALASFPEVGETLGPFRLLSELGRGASGRTFLATDPGLADRPVVVKVISDDQDEHLALARLRHTHIVPLFSEQSLPDRGLRILCMPFLGGASLAEILHDLAEIPAGQRSGKLLVERIDRKTSQAPGPGPGPVEAPFRRSLEKATYVQAITWIAACLADALHFAHARGFVHMDVKPSNVLITADGHPMLLDFHLARAPIAAGDGVADRLGGTPGWMSPEQLAAMASVEQGRPVPAAVDGRTDIFALGLLLREALAAPGPGSTRDGRDARSHPGVSVGLADITRKCLAEKPSERYQDAATLAEDLRRHLNDLPLKGVSNRSPVERWRKWRRRHPGALAWLVTAFSFFLATAAGLAVSVAAYNQRVGQILTYLEDARRSRASGQFDDAIRSLRHGLESAGALPAVGDLTRVLNEEILLAQRGGMARDLHELADLIRFRYGIDLPPPEDAEHLIRHCRMVWAKRERLIPAGGALVGPGWEQRVKTDLLELAAVWADLQLRLAPASGADQARRDALKVLDEATALFEPSLAIDLRREPLAEVLGQDPAAAVDASAREPRSPWEHYDLGRYYLRSGQIAAAAQEFRQTLDLRPQDFWSNFYQGLCAFRLHKFEDAVAAFSACIALMPQSAIGHYSRALAYDAQGRTEDAYRDYTGAIARDPLLTAALFNRGILSYKAGKHREAIADFEQALSTRPDRETVGRLRYNLALAQLAQGDRALALANAEESAQQGCQEARPLIDALRSR